MSKREHLMEVIAESGSYNVCTKDPVICTTPSSHKYHVHGVREDLAKEFAAKSVSYYVDSIYYLERNLDACYDYWKKVYSGFYVAMKSGYMTTLYVDRIY